MADAWVVVVVKVRVEVAVAEATVAMGVAEAIAAMGVAVAQVEATMAPYRSNGTLDNAHRV